MCLSLHGCFFSVSLMKKKKEKKNNQKPWVWSLHHHYTIHIAGGRLNFSINLSPPINSCHSTSFHGDSSFKPARTNSLYRIKAPFFLFPNCKSTQSFDKLGIPLWYPDVPLYKQLQSCAIKIDRKRLRQNKLWMDLKYLHYYINAFFR